MKMTLEGSNEEIQDFCRKMCFGISDFDEEVTEEDNPNIPIGDDDKDNDNDEGTEVVQKIIVVKKK